MKKPHILFSLSFFSLLIFILIFFTFDCNFTKTIDLKINSLEFQNTLTYSISIIIHYIFDPISVIIITLIICIVLWIKGIKKDSELFFIAVLSGGVLLYIFKELIQRIRPENILETGFSFPSGHATISAIFFGFLIYKTWRYLKLEKAKVAITIISIFLILLVGLSRIVLGVHWFSDVIAGWFLGSFILFFVLGIKNLIPIPN